MAEEACGEEKLNQENVFVRNVTFRKERKFVEDRLITSPQDNNIAAVAKLMKNNRWITRDSRRTEY